MILLALAASLATGGCRPQVPAATPPATHPLPKGFRPDSAYGGQATRKRVADKTPPTTLISTDAYTCTVTEATFNSTKVGDSVLCLWMWSR